MVLSLFIWMAGEGGEVRMGLCGRRSVTLLYSYAYIACPVPPPLSRSGALRRGRRGGSAGVCIIESLSTAVR